MIGWISSINILGAAIGGLITTLRIGKDDLKSIIRVGLLLTIGFELLSIFCQSETTILLVRFSSGIGGGMVYAAALAAFSGLVDSSKAFATYIVVYCFFGGMVLICLPWLMEAFGIKAGFIILAMMALLCMTILDAIDRVAKNVKERSFISLNYLIKNKYVLFGLLSYFLVQLAGGTMWAYSERIGKEAGLTIEFIGLVLGVSVALALVGGVLVMKVKKEWGIIKPLSAGLVIMGAGAMGLFYADVKVIFLIGNCISGAAWSFVIPFYQQMQANFDDAGRVVSLGTIVNMAGRSTGPAIAAISLGSSAFVNVLWISLIALTLSVLLAIPATKGIKAQAN